MDFYLLRAPLLPLDIYLDVSLSQSGAPFQRLAEQESIRCALAVGSLTLLEALESTRRDDPRAWKVESSLLRYLIRMSTRPTPFGLFAAVALGKWDDCTDLQLKSATIRKRTRPDMAWLMQVVMKLEAIPEVRQHLKLQTNPTVYTRGERIFLAERVSRGETDVPPAVSIRASGIVCRALLAAREPITFRDLVRTLLKNTPGARADQIEGLITQLWEQTLLLTDLRPPLTVESPVRYVVERLTGISEGAAIRAELQSILGGAAAWDAAPLEGSVERYRVLLARAAKTARIGRSPFQVDAALELNGRTVSRLVGEEAARAAEVLLRISPIPRGSVSLSTYRRAFEQRYGNHREVSVVELLDSNFGLGPPPGYTPKTRSFAAVDRTLPHQRNRTLMQLALIAMRDRVLQLDLNEQTLRRLETWSSSTILPLSLDLYVSIAAASRKALDAGEFQIVLGPNVGGLSAGRSVGRFADLLGGANGALEAIAAAEQYREPEKLFAELIYQPRRFRSANVSVRPNPRKYEIVLGVGASGGSIHSIPLDQIVVGVRDHRFYVRWPAAGRDVVITSGHMLNYLGAPAVCRFLAEVGRDGACQLTGFNWGPASNFPVLPRIQVGRTVLALAQWRISADLRSELPADEPNRFMEMLERWRTDWQVPRHVYLCSGDNRLLLDLQVGVQADELRRAILRLRGDNSVVLTEVLPDLNQAWLRDDNDRPFASELVIPLILGPSGGLAPQLDEVRRVRPEVPARAPSRAERVCYPGSEWLFVKLYGARELEDDLIAGPIRDLVLGALRSGMADGWFFLRYGDPEWHIRLRFRGDPERLLRELLPAICTMAADLIERGSCGRLVFDTYDREIERFGGNGGLAAAETLFAADSLAVTDLLHLQQTKAVFVDRLTLAILTVDALLEGLGLDGRSRFKWCQEQVLHNKKETGSDYRRRKHELRTLLADRDRSRETQGPAVTRILSDIREAGAELNRRHFELTLKNDLSRPTGEIYKSLVHLHLNRLLGADSFTERRVLGLLWRAREGLHLAPAQVA
jgi:thiopeptide-type bacteriocin biosynthesis protein